MTTPALPPEAISFFVGNISRTDGCWIWVGKSRDRGGYGVFHFAGKRYRAHRFSFEAFVGPIPPGLSVCHSCDNPPCVNPNHLWLGTNRDNTLDAVAKGRNVFGERHGMSIASDEEIRTMRHRFREGATIEELQASSNYPRLHIFRLLRGVLRPSAGGPLVKSITRSKSGHTGVSFQTSTNKWRVRTKGRVYIGLYATKEEAVAAYETASR